MFKQLLSVFLESHCVFCQRSTSSNILCQYCFQKLSSYQLSKSDRLNLYQTQSAFAWGKYDGLLKRAIALMKYDHKPEISNLLGTLLGQAWLNSTTRLPAKITVVPIPMHQNKQQKRGFNQAEIIAKSFCQVTGYRLNTKALIRVRETEAMFSLRSSAERISNLEGALQIGTKLPQYPVLLIDDIHTTGTTVKEAIKVLQQKDLEVVGVAVAAKAGLLK